MDVSVLAPLTRLDASASPADAVAALAAMCSLDSSATVTVHQLAPNHLVLVAPSLGLTPQAFKREVERAATATETMGTFTRVLQEMQKSAVEENRVVWDVTRQLIEAQKAETVALERCLDANEELRRAEQARTDACEAMERMRGEMERMRGELEQVEQQLHGARAEAAAKAAREDEAKEEAANGGEADEAHARSGDVSAGAQPPRAPQPLEKVLQAVSSRPIADRATSRAIKRQGTAGTPGIGGRFRATTPRARPKPPSRPQSAPTPGVVPKNFGKVATPRRKKRPGSAKAKTRKATEPEAVAETEPAAAAVAPKPVPRLTMLDELLSAGAKFAAQAAQDT